MTSVKGAIYMRDTIETENAIKGFFGVYRPFSNFDTTPFEIDGITFKSGEHAFQAHKATDTDTTWFEAIRGAETPSEAKRLGRQGTLRPDWEQVKLSVMKKVLLNKFGQNAVLKELLLSTGDKYLEETNDWRDTFWGVCNGTGRNMLGRLLMEVRGELR